MWFFRQHTDKSSKTKRSVKNNSRDKHNRKYWKSSTRKKDSDECKFLEEIPLNAMDSGDLIHMNLNTEETMADNFCNMASYCEFMRNFRRAPTLLPVHNGKSSCEEPWKLFEKSLEEEKVEDSIKQERDILKQHLWETQVLLEKTQKSRWPLDALKEEQVKSLTFEKRQEQYQNDCGRLKPEIDQGSRENAEINNQCSKMKDEIEKLGKEYEREKTLRCKVEDAWKAWEMKTIESKVTKGEELQKKVEELQSKVGWLEEKLGTQKESNDMLKDENNKIQHSLKLSQQAVQEKIKEINVLEEKFTAAWKRWLTDVKQTFSQQVEVAVQDFGRLSKPLELEMSTMERRIDKISEQLFSQKENSRVKTRELESKNSLLQKDHKAEILKLQDSHKRQIQQMKLGHLQALADQREEIDFKWLNEFDKQSSIPTSIPSKKVEDLEAAYKKMKQENLELKNIISTLNNDYQEQKTLAATLQDFLEDEMNKVEKLQDLAEKEVLEGIWEHTRVQSKEMEDLKRENQKIKQEKEALREKISTLEKTFEEKVQSEVVDIMRKELSRIKPRRSSVPEREIRRSNISSELRKRSRKKTVTSTTDRMNQNPTLVELLIKKQGSLRRVGKSHGDLWDSSKYCPDKAKTRVKIRKKTMVYKYKRQFTSKKEIGSHGVNSSFRRMSSSCDSRTDQSTMDAPLANYGESDSGGSSWGQSSDIIKSICNTSPRLNLTGSRHSRLSQQSLEESGYKFSSELSGNWSRTEKSVSQVKRSGSQCQSYEMDVHSGYRKSQQKIRINEEPDDSHDLVVSDNVGSMKKSSVLDKVNSLISPMID